MPKPVENRSVKRCRNSRILMSPPGESQQGHSTIAPPRVVSRHRIRLGSLREDRGHAENQKAKASRAHGSFEKRRPPQKSKLRREKSQKPVTKANRPTNSITRVRTSRRSVPVPCQGHSKGEGRKDHPKARSQASYWYQVMTATEDSRSKPYHLEPGDTSTSEESEDAKPATAWITRNRKGCRSRET
jgi:hypothetical protein